MEKLTSPFVLIKNSFDIFTKKENFLFLIKIYIPIAAVAAVSLGITYIPLLANMAETTAGKTINVILNILFLITGIFVGIAGIVGVGKVLDNKSFSVKDVYKVSFKKIWKFLLLSFLMAIIYLLGAVFLLIPLAIFVVWFAFSKFLMVEKDFGIKKSLAESKRMIKGIYWKVLFRLIIFGIFWFISEMIVASIPYAGMVIFYLCGAIFVLPLFLLYREILSRDQAKV